MKGVAGGPASGGTGGMAVAYWAVLASLLLGAAGQMFFRAGVRGAAPTLTGILQATLRPSILAGVACYGLSTLFWLQALSRLPLGLAYPLLGANFLLVPLAAHFLLGEPLTGGMLAGGLLIMLGVAVLGR